MNCRECKELLAPYVEGLLDPPVLKQFESHLSTCPVCRAELDEVQQVLELLASDARAVPGASLDTPVMDRVVREQALRLRRVPMKRAVRVTVAAAVLIGVCIGVWYLISAPGGGRAR